VDRPTETRDVREAAAMRRAVALSAAGGEVTHPNPNVGAVVLDAAGDVVGEGRHEHAGGPHAEVLALAAAGDRARGGTAVVTLEPCAHTGRTGPCSEALLTAGVARVVFAVAEPNPKAAGGADALRAAGVEVADGLLAAEAEAANERWLTGVRLRRPFVVWKVATTLDGRVAAADGTSRWISSPESRAHAHRLRAEVDTIVAGVGTVLADDSALTVRDPDGRLVGEQPLRVVVDTHGRTPAGARVLDDSAPTWVATAAELGAGPDGHVDLAALLSALHDKGRGYALLEGGPTLAGAFVRAGLVDRVVAYLAPTLLGAGVAALSGTGIGTLADGVALDVLDVERCGPDVLVVARPRRTDGGS
jgi:diaminohydroxyphosphoribosylaminopyrimidine deaminase/5-amino-6-(5-phosphoribosylamino)uracil reductase